MESITVDELKKKILDSINNFIVKVNEKTNGNYEKLYILGK